MFSISIIDGSSNIDGTKILPLSSNVSVSIALLCTKLYVAAAATFVKSSNDL